MANVLVTYANRFWYLYIQVSKEFKAEEIEQLAIFLSRHSAGIFFFVSQLALPLL